MPGRLTIESKAGKQEFPCRAILTIGRDKNSDIKIDDPQASRNHAMIRLLGSDDYYLIDSGSVNGSYINSKRITTPTLLKDGDLLQFGSLKITYNHEKQEEQAEDSAAAQSTVLMQSFAIRQITILVADIRGFTTLSEEIPIAILTKVMSEWFRYVSECIIENGGAVDKFIGDCVYARWEATKDASTTVMNALKAASSINKVTQKLNDQYDELPRKFQIGVGINTGQAAVGIGQDNTAIGDAVNLAFRLESSSKQFKKDIVMSESSYKHVSDKLWKKKQSEITVKGKKEPVKVCALNFGDVDKFIS